MRQYPKLIRTEEAFKGRVFSVERRYFEHQQQEIERAIIKHNGAVVILPIPAPGKVLLIKQFRYTFQREIYELPAGTIEAGEDPLSAAKREIEEEIGFQGHSWHHLGDICSAPGFCTEMLHCFVVQDLFEQKQQEDFGELISVEEWTLLKLEDAIRSGIIHDAKTISLYAMAKLKGFI